MPQDIEQFRADPLDIPSLLKLAVQQLLISDREKVALENPFGLDAYVVVCAFSTFGHFIRFSYHPWLE